MEYLKRVKEYIDLSKVKTKSDLEIRLSRQGLLGKVRQYKQLNIITEELGLERVVTGEAIRISKVTTKQTITRYKKPVTVYRDNKGRFKKHVK